MKTIKLICLQALILLLIAPQAVQAQAEWGLKTGTATGYEWNILRSPDSYTLDGELLGTGDLWRSALRTDVTFNPNLDIKKGKNRIKLETDFNSRLYLQNADANLYSWTTGAKFSRKLSKKFRYIANADYRLNRRAVQPENEDILQLPDSYDKITWETGLKYRPGNWHFADAGVFGTFKRFRSDREDPTRYMEIGLWAADRHKMKKTGARDHQYSWEVRWKERFYASQFTEIPFGEPGEPNEEGGDGEENEEEEGEENEVDNAPGQHWRYLRVGADYDLPVGKNWTVVPKAHIRLRKDVRNTQATFRELGLGMGVVWEKGKARFSGNVGYQFRTYPGFTIGTGDEADALRYQYIKTSLKFSYEMTERIDVFVSANNWSRISNNTRTTSRDRRSFANTAVMMGVNFTLGN